MNPHLSGSVPAGNWPEMKFKLARLKTGFEEQPLLRLLMAGVVILGFTLSIRWYVSGPNAVADYAPGNPGVEVVVEVQPGDTGAQIGTKLYELGVIKSSAAFFREAVSDSRSSRIAPGEHLVQTRIPAKVALEQMLDPKRIPNLVTVRDGARLSEIRNELADFGFSEDQIKAAFERVSPPDLFDANYLEGFLYPAQYSFNKNVSAEFALGEMVEKFQWITKEVNWQASSEFTPYELMIIASLVESEGTPDVFAKVSRVVYNRLKIGMPLQFDSTVHYALDRRGEIRVSIKETKVNSRYNTFKIVGLPPTPIGSPTIKAIDAALNPEPGDWLYFVTVKPKETRFTRSYEEFLLWKAEYKRNFRAGLFE